MFSKEWFVYVFGRWVVVSGIAGAIVQYLFSDLLRIHTIPAFLLNQLCLACVFWYVDKLIFKRHFKDNLLNFFRFPRIKHAFGLKEQCAMLNREFGDFKSRSSGNEESPALWLNEFVDLVHAVEMTELLLREHKIDIDAEFDRVREENTQKGLYLTAKSPPAAPSPSAQGNDFLALLKKEVVVADGAMGTRLQEKGFARDSCLEHLNCTHPELVASIHAEYLDAGARLIETNTFGANRLKLAKYGLGGKVREINLAGARLARRAAGDKAFVAGAVGPLGRLISPYGNVGLAEAHAAFREQIEALAEGGIDLIIIETMTSLLEAREALLICKETCGLPVICQMSFVDDGATVQGDEAWTSLKQLKRLGADVVGMNCSLGPQEMLQIVANLAGDGQEGLSVQPNAGMPEYKNGSICYPSGPDYFSRYAPLFRHYGARIIGGCCGTTPGHIAAIAGALKSVNQEAIGMTSISVSTLEDGPLLTKCERSAFPAWLSTKPFVTVETSPPKDLNVQKALRDICQLQEAGADAVNVTENPMARMHMSSLAFSALIKQQIALRIIMHFTARDRNLLAIQSDLLGAAALGVDGILALKGDPAGLGDIPYASSVYDVSTEGLIKIIQNMNSGRFMMKEAEGMQPRLEVAVGANPNSPDMKAELERLKGKVDAGAHLIITQAVYDIKNLERFVSGVAALSIPVLVGVLPLKSCRQADYLHNEVPGITIPEALRRAMFSCSGVDAGSKGLEIASAFIADAAAMVSGFYLMPPKNYVNETLQLIGIIKSHDNVKEVK